MSKKFLKLAIIIAFLGVLIAPSVTLATNEDYRINALGSFKEVTVLATSDLRATIAKIINGAMMLLGVVAVVIILIGGFKWMTAMGNDEAVKKAKTLIIQGVIGLIIVVCSYALAQFILDQLEKATR